MQTTYVPPSVWIVASVEDADFTVTTVNFEKLPPRYIAPASLHLALTDPPYHFELHREVTRRGNAVSLATYGPQEYPPPLQGETYFLQSWWTDQAVEAALDTYTQWEFRVYPDNGDHDHCLFTYAGIAANDENRTGYWSKKYGWITERAYRDFIVADIYHLRSGSTTG